MGVLENLVAGFEVALTPVNLFYCFLGVFFGTFVGTLPGIGALAAISILLPITFYLEPTAAIIMLAGIYYGGVAGGSTASILLNLPGSPSTAITCLDGYPMSRKGKAGLALLTATLASFIGGTAGIIVLTAFAPALAELAVDFGPAEYFMLTVFGLIATATIASGSAIKGLAMVVLGMLFGTVGTDVYTAQFRLTYGLWDLAEGIDLIALSLGLFGVSEVIASINRITRQPKSAQRVSMRSMLPTRDDLKRASAPVVRGTGIGSALGALPGAGATLASFIAYAFEKRLSRDPSRFGKGAIEGVAAPESANNAAVQTAFIPTLTLGIPGDGVMALMLAALMIHGIVPGPGVVSKHPDLFWGLVASFWIGNVLLLVLHIPLIGIWVRLLQVPYHLLYPAILMLICIGVYSVNMSPFGVYLVLFFGLVGYAMRLLGFEPAPLIVGFVLGPMLENHLRRAMLLARGDVAFLVERPISAGLLVLSVVMLVWMLASELRNRAKGRSAASAADG